VRGHAGGLWRKVLVGRQAIFGQPPGAEPARVTPSRDSAPL
jgi:hypothetical protein